jgi:hypothetical protein
VWTATVIDDINFNPEFLEPYLEQTVQLIFKVRVVLFFGVMYSEAVGRSPHIWMCST